MSIKRIFLTAFTLSALLGLTTTAFAQGPAVYNGNGWSTKAALYQQLDNTTSFWGQTQNTSVSPYKNMIYLPYDPVTELYDGPSFQFHVLPGSTVTELRHDHWDNQQAGASGGSWRIIGIEIENGEVHHLINRVPILPILSVVGDPIGYGDLGGPYFGSFRLNQKSQAVATAEIRLKGMNFDQVVGTINPGQTKTFPVAGLNNAGPYTLFARTTAGWKVVGVLYFLLIETDPGGGGGCLSKEAEGMVPVPC